MPSGKKLSTEDAAVHIGSTVSTMAKLRLRGGGPPFYKLGHKVVYDTAELDDWLASRRRVSTSDTGSKAA